MTEIVRDRLGNYLRKYINIKPGYHYESEAIIKQGIGLLAKEHGIEEVQRGVLRECSVLIAREDLEEWTKLA